ncbi:MAG TPA: DUF6084 family protein [Thermoleophilaceae bacterium]|nr:DUF6084 family protein [Thermoleophilaceae bacterium]
MADQRAAPSLAFAIDNARAVEYAAVATLAFDLRVSSTRPVRALQLDVQLQIAARRRSYDEPEQERLWELFGTPDRWSDTLRTLPWLRASLAVPPFAGETLIELPVVCTYDLEVTAARYFAALVDGVVPLEFLFSGAVFYADDGGRLQMVRIDWDSEAQYRMPVAVWRAAIDRHFPDSAWLRLGREPFDRLQGYKARRGLLTIDEAVELLLDEAGA